MLCLLGRQTAESYPKGKENIPFFSNNDKESM